MVWEPVNRSPHPVDMIPAKQRDHISQRWYIVVVFREQKQHGYHASNLLHETHGKRR